MATQFVRKSWLRKLQRYEDAHSDPYSKDDSLCSLYGPIPDSDADSIETLIENKRPQVVRADSSGWLIAVNILLFCISAVMLAISQWELLAERDPMGNSWLRKVSVHSPIFDAIHIPLIETRRNGSFVASSAPSIFREPPSPEVDAAWRRISNISPIPMSTRDVMLRGGANPANTARFPEGQFGFGPDAHVARLDVFHQIHCLNALRMEMNFDYYYGGKFKDDIPTPSHQAHVGHCLEIVLQALTCSASVDPIMHYWVDIQEMPFPNFNDRHVCRDFEAILAWNEENSVDLETFKSKIRRPNGVRVHRMSDEYKAMQALNQIATVE